MERKKNTIRNIIWGTINKIILTIVPFITRTVIIKILGSEYLGLNSLFTSILQILNLTELGISSAIVYFMYKPIANNDVEKISALLNLYKKLYRLIGAIIFICGIIILPFLDKFISGEVPDNINIYILYIMYLINTVATYWLFAYKKSLLQAFQRNDIVSNVNSILYLVQVVIQMIIIFAWKNYYLYVLIIPIITIVDNIICAVIAKKKYPNYIAKGIVSKETKKELKKKVSGLMVYKICTTTRNSLDSIFISAFLGLNMVGIYNNYYYVLTAVKTFMSVLTSSMLSGIGNSIAVESVEKNYNDMNKFNFMYMLIGGWCTICMLCLYQPFMNVWVGQEYMLDFNCVVLFCIYFYSLCMGDIRATYSDAAGLWWESRYRAILESIFNIVLNYILGKVWGLKGIIVATLISLLVINFAYGSSIIFKYYFKKQKLSEYYISHLKYFFITTVISVITYILCTLIPFTGILELIIKALICLIVPTGLYIVAYRKNKYLIDMKNMIIEILKRR